MAAQRQTIGFVGLGAMGFGMATHLVKRGYSVHGFDVFQQNVKKFADNGGIPASSLQESALHAQVYICMVANAPQAQGALFDGDHTIVQNLPHGSTLLLCSTVPSSFAKAAARQIEELRPDVFFVDCPVSGGTYRAADGTLSIMAGASQAAIEKGRGVLSELSDERKLFIVEGGIGQGSNMKMVHQVLAAVQILATSEALGFAAHLGLDAGEVREAVLDSDAWSWMFENRSPRSLTEDYLPPVSALTIILKDVGIITDMARQTEFPTVLCSCAEQVYLKGLAQGWAADDDASMVRYYFEDPVRSVVTEHMPTEQRQRGLQLVASMLRAIHLCAAGEAIAFARALGIPLDQFYDLASNAAGGSTMFNTCFQGIVKSGRLVPDEEEEMEIARISEVVKEAQRVQCPAPLATSSMNVLLMSRRDRMRPS